MEYDLSNPTNPVIFLDVSIGGKIVGRVLIELFADVTPLTAENFRLLCVGSKNLTYQGTLFHRITPDFIIQGGDVASGDGRGSESAYGGHFADENFIRKHTGPYQLTMANCGPNTNGSQFLITLCKSWWLDNKHVVFGRIIKGTDVIDQVAKLGNETGIPREDCRIEKCGEIRGH